MKKILLILSMFTFLNLFSQEYVPLLKEGNKWWVSYKEGYYDGGPQFPQQNYWYYLINGETTINGVAYKKIYSNYYRHCQAGCQDYNNPDDFECLMREDITTRKIYFLDSNTNTEKLIYDFSANVGDVINSSWRIPFLQDSEITIADISYGTVFGKNVKAFVLNGYYNIYEGIGSQSGLFSQPSGPSFELPTYWLDCFEDTSGKSCNSYFLGTKEKDFKKNLTLYYSKEHQNFKILEDSSKDFKIDFYEASGKLTEEVKIKGNQNFALKNNVKSKILFYVITHQSHSWKGKIVIP